jgi:hypothetical protein
VHPLKSVSLLLNNLLTRLLGAVVRTFVILVGLFFLSFVAIFGFVVNVLWISFPLLMVVSFFYMADSDLSFFVAVASIFLLFLFAFFYYLDSRKSLMRIPLEELVDCKIFDRICGRIGIARKRFPEEIVGNEKLMEEFLKARRLTQKDFAESVQLELLREQKNRDNAKFWHWDNLKTMEIWLYGEFGQILH